MKALLSTTGSIYSMLLWIDDAFLIYYSYISYNTLSLASIFFFCHFSFFMTTSY